MIINPNRRLSRNELEADQLALDAVRDLPGYQSLNPEYTLERLNELDNSFREAQQQERRAANAFESARDTLIAVARQRHDALFGAKRQVIAQYGPDSNAVQSLGLKKKSERRAPRRESKSDTPVTPPPTVDPSTSAPSTPSTNAPASSSS